MKTAAVVVAIAACACGQAEGNLSGEPEGDIRGVEELASPDLTALNSLDAAFNATSGALAVTLRGSETALVVSMRASDTAILLNGNPVLSTVPVGAAVFATKANVKSAVVNVAAASTTVIFDYYNGTFIPGTKPATTSASFGAGGGTTVNFGTFAGGAFKIRGQQIADTIYAGQDAATPPNVLISYSKAFPDVQVSMAVGAQPTFSFSLGAGNDVFDATGGAAAPAWATTLGAHAVSLTFPVIVHGGVGNDSITGGTGADTFYGDEGINTVDERSGSLASHTADTVYGLTTLASAPGTNVTTVTYANWLNVATGVKVDIVHLATAGQKAAATAFAPAGFVSAGVTDYIDDTVAVVVGSPLADTMQCSQLTDVPCFLYGGPGNDTLTPGMSSALNTEYLIGGDGADTFAMNQIGNKVVLIGGNDTDTTATVNLYADTVDYSNAIALASELPTMISLNGAASAPAACTAAIVTASVTAGTFPRCPGTPDATSGQTGLVHTDIRNDIRVAKCPTGVNSVGVVCTVRANAAGDTIYSGHGADVLAGGAGNDTFVIADYDATGVYTGAVTKLVTGGGGSDTADFSARTVGTNIDLHCLVAAAGCIVSGNANAAYLANTAPNAAAIAADEVAIALDVTAVATALGAISPGPATTDDNGENTAAGTAGTSAAAAAGAGATFHSGATPATAAAVTAAVTAAAADNAALATAIGLYTAPADNAPTHTAAALVHTNIAAILGALTAEVAATGEGVELVAVSNAVCPSGGTKACSVTTGAGSSTVDFSGDGAVAGSSLTCESSDVLTINAAGLAANCGT